MTRLKFKKINNTLLETNEIFCDNEYYIGIIKLKESNIEWAIINSNNKLLLFGTSKTSRLAKQKLKEAFVNLGALINKEHRKYKIII